MIEEEEGGRKAKPAVETIFAYIAALLESYVFYEVKHFALNENESLREGLLTWCNEQAMRELYLKAFEIPVKEGGSTAIMSSFNSIGTTWTGGSQALNNDVLRGEWGFRGAVVTDYYLGSASPSMNGYDGLYGGNDLWLAPMTDMGLGLALDITSPTVVNQLRRACHNILYMSANSNLVDSSYAEQANITVAPVTEKSTGTPLWAVLFYGVFNVLYVITIAGVIFWIVKGRKTAQ